MNSRLYNMRRFSRERPPRRHSFRQKQTPWLAAIAVSGACGAASADLALPLGLITRTAVPANGVLRFPSELTVRIIAPDGEEVPGRFVDEGVWRPDEPFQEGLHKADVSYELKPERAEDRSFEVVPALTLPADFVDIMVSTQVDTSAVLEEACCEGGAARTAEGVPCSSECAPLCVPLSYSVQQTVQVSTDMDWQNPLAWQVEVRRAADLEANHFGEGYWELKGNPDKLCGAVDVFSWLDDTTIRAVQCIDNPKPSLAPIRESPSSFGHITECTAPPAGLESNWCLAQAYTCETELLTGDEDSYEALSDACSHYYTTCDRSPPESPFAAPSAGAQDSVENSHGDQELVEVESGNNGCRCAMSAASDRSWPTGLVTCGLAVWLLWCRRQLGPKARSGRRMLMLD